MGVWTPGPGPTSGDDTFVGDATNELADGGDGDDVLDGGDGADTLTGGAGDDLIRGGRGPDVLDGGDGVDTADYSASASGVHVDLSLGLGFGGEAQGDTLSGFEIVLGSAFADYLIGSASADELNGGDGRDVLIGGAGNDLLIGGHGGDTLDGGAGHDVMRGGTGSDIYYVNSTADTVIELENEGTDAVRSTINYTLGANLENLALLGHAHIRGIGNGQDNVITGNNGNNLLSGDAGNDTLVGGAGNDTLIGGAGADVLRGGRGADVYEIDADDTIIELAGEGIDTVNGYSGYTLGANLENLNVSGVGTGNERNNVITGRDGDDELDGAAGDDALIGGIGNDTLVGGAGADRMEGGANNDAYFVDDAGDSVIELANEGIDTVHTSITYTLARNIENLTLLDGSNINGFGNDFSNIMTGNSGNNYLKACNGHDTLIGGDGNDTLRGNGGADVMIGGAGDDTYYVDNVGDQVSELGSQGLDRVFARIDYALGAHVENLILLGSAAVGTGNGLDNLITGNDGDNLLEGRAGNDTLRGGAGADTLVGGEGADTFVFNTPLGAGNVDTIVDFSEADDTIVLNSGIFRLGTGRLDASAFHIGAAAENADHRIIYDSATGALYYDADGAGEAEQIQFAQLTAGLTLTNADFLGV